MAKILLITNNGYIRLNTFQRASNWFIIKITYNEPNKLSVTHEKMRLLT